MLTSKSFLSRTFLALLPVLLIFMSSSSLVGLADALSSTQTQTAHNNFLLPHLRKAFPDVQSYKVLQTIVQSNAKGFILQLQHKEDTCTNDQAVPDRVFVKWVNAADYVASKKDWADLRRTLLYARTEERFYANLQPLLRKKGFTQTPKCYLSESYLDGWIADEERATDAADASVDKDTLPDAANKGGLIVLECLDTEQTYFQDSPLTIPQCQACLKAVARLHAAGWQDRSLLEDAARDLSRASFHLATRNPKELAAIDQTWQGFCEAFKAEMVEAGLLRGNEHENDSGISALGRRLAAVANYVSEQVSPSPTDAYATLTHGDYKALNIFLPRTDDTKSSNNEAILVDFASSGVGLGMSDVAMHVHHAVVPEQLADGGEEALVRYYWECLCEAGVTDYPWEVAWRHYKLAVVDYGRFFMARMWKNATPETMHKKKGNTNVNLINRSPPAAMAFVERLNKYLSEIEAEIENGGSNALKGKRKADSASKKPFWKWLFPFIAFVEAEPTMAFTSVSRRTGRLRTSSSTEFRHFPSFAVSPTNEEKDLIGATKVAEENFWERAASTFIDVENLDLDDDPEQVRRYYEVISVLRIGVPALLWATGAHLAYPYVSMGLATAINDSGVFAVVSQDASQYIQNILTTSGLVFSLLAGQTFYFMYQQQEAIYLALFEEVTMAKSLLEQVSLVCQGRQNLYQKILACIDQYVREDLTRFNDMEPAMLISSRPVDDPLENILYYTSVGEPSIVYQTVRSLRQARAYRLGALQRKLPPIHTALLYSLAAIVLFTFPLLGAGSQTIGGPGILTVQAWYLSFIVFGITLVMGVIEELQHPGDKGAYNAQTVLAVMLCGLREDLALRLSGEGIQQVGPSIDADGFDGYRALNEMDTE